MTLQFTKMQGVGNDFIVVDGHDYSGLDWPALAPRLCDRRFGIGSDGILVVEHSTTADARMRMFNPDGTEDFCGNGLRCVAKFVADRRQTTDDRRQTNFSIETIAGVRRADINTNGMVTVEMGEPRFQPNEIPVLPTSLNTQHSTLNTLTHEIADESVTLYPLSTGTTHSILFVDELPDDERFFRLSPKIEHHPAFPERTSVMWTKVESGNRLSLRIWERGAGETWGCGTGASAAAVAANLLGHTGQETTVLSKGGELQIRWPGEGPILMTGPAEYIYRGTLEFL